MYTRKEITDWMEYFWHEFFPTITQKDSDTIYEILHWVDEKKAAFLLAKQTYESKTTQGKTMDKKIKALQKKTKAIEKDESSLLKMDKKNDKKIAKADKIMKKK